MTKKRDPLPRYRPWTETGLELGTLYAILWLLGVAGLCGIWPRGSPYQLTDLVWWLSLPFLIPVLPALILTIALWLRVRRQGYASLWAGLAAGLRRAIRAIHHNLTVSLPTTASPALILGQDDTGRSIQLDTPALDCHFLVTGRTRMGKSSLLADLAYQDASRGDCAVVVVDPHASVVDHLLLAGLDARVGDRLVALFPDQDHVPGLNLLQPLPGEDPAACAHRLVETAVNLWFQGDHTEARRFQDVIYHAAWALAATGWTVLEIEPVLLCPDFRRQVTAQISAPPLRAWLEDLDRQPDSHIRDLVASTVTRCRDFAHGPAALIFGQRQISFDLACLLDHQGILLVALPTATLGDAGAYLTAGVLLDLMDTTLARRPKNSAVHTNPPVRLVLDEVQAYAGPALRHLLAERAGYGASGVLATQGLTQLADPQWARFILTNTSIRAVFAGHAAEARLLAEELFRPDPLQVKYQRDPWLTFYSPEEQITHWSKTIQHLPPHTFFAHAAGGEPVRAQTRPLPVRRDAAALAAVRAALARRGGRPRAEVAAELAQRRERIYGRYQPPAESADGWF